MPDLVQIEPRPAGNFSEWLRQTEASLQSGSVGSEVPCGACTACCRSSMFVHIAPEEEQTIRRIPRPLLFPAPGRPQGHLVMGYNEQGHCPMLVDNRCSIYQDRPRTCRDYDCRVFRATGVPVDAGAQPDIALRVREWVFDFESVESRREQATLQQAAAFLVGKKNLFPPGTLPTNPGELAALAVIIYQQFAAMPEGPDAAIADAILACLER